MDPATQAQLDYVKAENDLRARSLQRLHDLGPLPDVMPRAYDKWVSCDPLSYFAVFAVLTYELRRYANLLQGKGPYYCPQCEEPQEGWRKMLCWECAWPGKIRDYAIECATRWHETSERNSQWRVSA